MKDSDGKWSDHPIVVYDEVEYVRCGSCKRQVPEVWHYHWTEPESSCVFCRVTYEMESQDIVLFNDVGGPASLQGECVEVWALELVHNGERLVRSDKWTQVYEGC